MPSLSAEELAKVNSNVSNLITSDSIGMSSRQNVTDTVTLGDLSTGTTTITKETLAGISSEAEDAISTSNILAQNASISLGTKYMKGTGRLVSFTYADGSDDNSRRAYMQLQGNVSAMSSIIEGEDKNLLQTVYNHLVNGYTAIVITQMQENLQERQSIMPTVGDSFATTFSGLEPQVMVISGYLPFDAATDNSSWFISFVNAYKYFIRASQLAKYRCSLRLVFPDFASYTCYPVSISTSMVSDQDTFIPFSMTAVVVSNPINKAYGYSSSVTSPTSTVEDVQQAVLASTQQSDIEQEVTKSPSEIGALESKKSWVESVSDWVHSVDSSQTMQTINKTLAVTNQVIGAIDAISGRPYGERYYSGKIGRGSYE